MIRIEQRQDYKIGEKIKPGIFNQIGENINRIAAYINNSDLIVKIEIEQSQWNENQFIFNSQGITEEDLAIVWFDNSSLEAALECEITVETIEDGIKFSCETVPYAKIGCSVEVKKVES